MNTLTLFSIIITVLSLIYIILAYYGLIRYFKLKQGQCQTYTESYLQLPRVESKSKVVVSMYMSSEADLANNLTFKSILDQTVHPDQIIIVSKHHITLPDFIAKNNIVVVQKENESYGKTSAFMVPLTSQKDANTKIIIITDGVVYGPDFIETLVEESEKSPDSLIYVEMFDSSAYVNQSKMVKSKSGNEAILRVSSGVLVKPVFFNKFTEVMSDDALESPNTFLTVNALANKVKMIKSSFNEVIKTKKEVPTEAEKHTIRLYAYIFKL